MVARIIAILVAVLIIAGHNAAQQRPAVTAADYERAERLLAANTAPLVLRAGVRPAWLPEEKFWYRVTTENGAEFFMVDAAGGTKAPAFDHAKMAAALSAAAGETYRAFDLPFQQFDLSADSKSIAFTAGARRFTCALSGDKCAADAEQAQPQGGQGGGAKPPISTSPDGKRGVFIRNYNLWMRDVATGRETQLTTDGIKDFGYATDNAGWTKSDRPVVVWSPDSKKVATFQHDGRGVGDMYLVDTRVGHPNLQAWKYPLPGDEKIFMIERVVIEIDSGKTIRLQMPPDPHRSSLCDHVVCGGEWVDVQWSADGTQLAFVSTSRDHKSEKLRIADATGKIRDVLEETVATYFEGGNDRVNWRFLPASNEVIWFSERDNWGQLYLYDRPDRQAQESDHDAAKATSRSS